MLPHVPLDRMLTSRSVPQTMQTSQSLLRVSNGRSPAGYDTREGVKTTYDDDAESGRLGTSPRQESPSLREDWVEVDAGSSEARQKSWLNLRGLI